LAASWLGDEKLEIIFSIIVYPAPPSSLGASRKKPWPPGLPPKRLGGQLAGAMINLKFYLA
jgi:hypothetical protein